MREFVNNEGIEMVEMPREELDGLLAKTAEESTSKGIYLMQKSKAATELMSAVVRLLRL